jgi:putative sporulation protein YtxC
MKSFCIKTNNKDILDYLLSRTKEIDFEDLIYSKNKFKIYQNVIIHYEGKDEESFSYFLSELITEVILEFYEEKLIYQILNYNYFYFDEYEKIQICNNCISTIENDYIEIQENKENINRKQIIQKALLSFIQENKSMILDGFINFRLKEYMSYLDNIVDTAVNQFVIEKEYNEFVNLLKIYIDSKPAECDILHLIYINGESILLDADKNIVSVSENILNSKYLSDISFSSNDFALNTLLTLLPAKVEMHVIGIEDEFIDTIKQIFEGRVSVCKDCNICRTYRLLNHAKIE